PVAFNEVMRLGYGDNVYVPILLLHKNIKAAAPPTEVVLFIKLGKNEVWGCRRRFPLYVENVQESYLCFQGKWQTSRC
ncbi:MAG: hypothetical protein LBH61_05300, partial [Dysgonamonadaceae bacterium]|nr:hypothetical protein [Dysgonamonadaceae bacterium]